MTPSEVGAAAPFALLPIEVATGLVYGAQAKGNNLPRIPPDVSMRRAIEDVVLVALKRGPVAVSFSGGRDSSAVLAIATHVARREGFDDPVPVTLRYLDAPAADESQWQSLVLERLQIHEHEILHIRKELDLLGPVARRVMRRHGLLWPPNGFTHDLMLERCAGATLLTGGGGDELLDQSAANRTQLMLAGRIKPSPRDVARLASAVAAPRLYARRQARFQPNFAWLSAGGQAEFARRHVADSGPPYRSWARGVAEYLNARSFTALQCSQALMAADHGAQVAHPFLDPRVLAAAGRDGGRLGLGGRTRAMRQLVGDLLPEELVSRETKASFGAGFWAQESIAFASTAEAIEALASDAALRPLLDLEALGTEWQEPMPHFLTASLLQAAFISLGRHEAD